MQALNYQQNRGVNRSIQIGKYSFSPMFLPKYKEEDALKKQTIQMGQLLMYRQLHLIMVLMDSSIIKVA